MVLFILSFTEKNSRSYFHLCSTIMIIGVVLNSKISHDISNFVDTAVDTCMHFFFCT